MTPSQSSINHKGGTDYLLYSLDFTGRVKRNLLIADGGSQKEKARVEKTYSYNQSSKVKSICQRTSLGTTTDANAYWEPVARYGYNSMGDMIKDTLGCALQVVDYKYNLQGWLKKINNVT